MGYNKKKSIATHKYEEFGILCALKPSVKCRTEIKQSMNTLTPFFSKQQNRRWNKAVLR